MTKQKITSLSPARAGDYIDKDGNIKQLYGVSTKFDEKYRLDQVQYPSDLHNNKNEYGGNYVVFYINVASDSRLLKDDKLQIVDSEIPPRLRGDLIGQNFDGNDAIGGVTAVAGVSTLGASGIINKIKSKGVKSLGKSLNKAAIGGALAGTALIAANSAGMARQQKRLLKTIALHIPNQLSIRYSTQWQDDETFAFQAGAIAAREVGKALAVDGSKHNLGVANDFAVSLLLQKTPVVGSALSASSGLAGNPKKEQIFKSVNFREFTFDYTFAPRSPEEAKSVRDIIKTFKLHMHPEYKDTNNFIFLYPSEFDIYYYQDGEENLNLHRHTSCVLVDMMVNNTPNGMFNTFDDGMPTQINVQLTFRELAILTKDQIQDGY